MTRRLALLLVALLICVLVLAVRTAAAERLPFWKTCETGYLCARRVLPHYFEDWRRALRIVDCETGGTYSNRAHGRAGERGWFQIHPVHFGWVDEGRLWDVRYNTRIAWRLSEHGRDWSPWTCA